MQKGDTYFAAAAPNDEAAFREAEDKRARR
jgi:hypothetical protein